MLNHAWIQWSLLQKNVEFCKPLSRVFQCKVKNTSVMESGAPNEKFVAKYLKGHFLFSQIASEPFKGILSILCNVMQVYLFGVFLKLKLKVAENSRNQNPIRRVSELLKAVQKSQLAFFLSQSNIFIPKQTIGINQFLVTKL